MVQNTKEKHAYTVTQSVQWKGYKEITFDVYVP